MKARTKKLTAISLGLVMGTTTFATVLQADTITKTLKATYNNIKVTFNGAAQQPANEPFMVNGSVYVSLRDAGQMTGNAVNWDSLNKTVQITNSNTNNSVSSTEIANKNLEIANLRAQVKQLEEKLAKYETTNGSGSSSAGSNLSKSEIEKTLEEIQDKYEKKYSVKWEFALVENKGGLKLDITVPRSSSSDFNELTSSKIEDFLESVCKDIAYYHKNVEIKGTVTDAKLDQNVIDFTYSKTGKFSLSSNVISDYSLRKFARELEDDRNYRALPTINYETLKNEAFTVTGIELELDRRGETITAHIGVSTDKKVDWNALVTNGGNDDRSTVYKDAYLSRLASFLEDITYDIDREFDIDRVEAMIYNTKNLGSRDSISKGDLMVRYELDRYEDYIMTLVKLPN